MKYIGAIILATMIGTSPVAIAKKKDKKQQPITAIPLPPNKVQRDMMPTSNSPIVPMVVDFAGTKVDFDRIDMYERLDRELTAFAYGHSSTYLVLKRANRFFPAIIPILKEYGIPEDFIYLAAIESYFNLRAYSYAKAAGIWQFMPSTGRQYGLEINDDVDERYHTEKATIAACKYLKDGYRKYGDWSTVSASYNAGMGRISSELDKQQSETTFDLYLNEETSRYVFRIIAMKLILENPKTYGFNLFRNQLYQPTECKEYTVSGAVPSWSDWAKERGVSYAQLKEENPWIRSKSLQNKSGKTYIVKVPLADELYRSKRSFNTYNKNWTVD